MQLDQKIDGFFFLKAFSDAFKGGFSTFKNKNDRLEGCLSW